MSFHPTSTFTPTSPGEMSLSGRATALSLIICHAFCLPPSLHPPCKFPLQRAHFSLTCLRGDGLRGRTRTKILCRERKGKKRKLGLHCLQRRIPQLPFSTSYSSTPIFYISPPTFFLSLPKFFWSLIALVWTIYTLTGNSFRPNTLARNSLGSYFSLEFL